MRYMLRRRSAPRAEPPLHASEPKAGARHLVLVVLDSLRYDSWLAAEPRNLARIGEVERRWSYASWTAPSHYNMLMGLLPHSSPAHVYASEYYKQDFLRYSERLGIEGIEFRKLLPSIFLPTFLKESFGYRTTGMVSMPVLNEHTPINRDFDTYELMPTHNDMAKMLDRMEFDETPAFYMLNVGETHYPYALPDEDPSEWPRISGAHGVLRSLDEEVSTAQSGEPMFFDEGKLEALRDRQLRAVGYIDTLFEKIFDLVPRNTWLIVTSDHGELFGECGYFGHGPIAHEKVFEVPYVEGLRP